MTFLLTRTKGLLACCILVATAACSAEKEPVIAEICVVDEHELIEFLALMRSVAASEGMTFYDESAEAQVQRESIARRLGSVDERLRAVNVAFDGHGRRWVAISNLGLPSYQLLVAIREEGAARNGPLQQRLLRETSGRWNMKVLPPGASVQPSKTCETTAAGSAPG